MNIKTLSVISLCTLSLILFSCTDEQIIVAESNCPEIIVLNYDEEWINDTYIINNVSLSESQELELNISHSGGCQEHEYELIQNPQFCGTPPIYISIKLSHNSNGDICEAWITKDLCFDISSIYSENGTDEITIGLYNTHQTDTTWVLE
tara:strand:+ start:82 stop:528 length:447 start_codon:yes stop_codon:yes gene_type:complete